jgi:DnaD/phage-associated family protein
MAKMPWLKLYTEIRTDPKMQSLSDLEFRTWINILCLSAESKVRGIICIEEGLAYPIEGLARTLFISTDELTSCLNKFQKLRMIDLDEDGIIEVIHFDDRQYEKPSDKPEEVAKRAKKHRLKNRNAKVTPKQREENAIEEDIDKEEDIDINNNNNNAREEENVLAKTEPADLASEADAIPENKKPIGTQAVNWAEKNWGRMLSPGETKDITAWCDEFSIRGSPEPDAVVTEALKQCDLAGVRNMKYLRAVLTDWREAGVLTVADVEAREAERKSQKEHKRNKDPVDKHPQPSEPGKYDNFYL